MAFHRVCFLHGSSSLFEHLKSLCSMHFMVLSDLPSQLLIPPFTEEAAGRWEHSSAIKHSWCSLRHAPVTKLWGRWVVGWASPWPKLPSQISGNSTCNICAAFPECQLPSVLLICHYLNTSTVQREKADLLSWKQAQMEHFTSSLMAYMYWKC